MRLELHQKLYRVAARIRRLHFWSGLAACWMAWALLSVITVKLANTAGWVVPPQWPTFALLALATAIAWGIIAHRLARDERAVARRVEERYPELATLLLAAVEEVSRRRPPGKGPSFLQATVIRQALEHGRSHDWQSAVSSWKLQMARLVQFIALGLFVATCAGMASGGRMAATGGSWPADLDSAAEYRVTVDPGDMEIERGSPLLVVAEFAGAVPPEARLIVEVETLAGDNSGVESAAIQSIHMLRSLDDPKFVGRVAEVNRNLAYRVEFDGGASKTYRARVFDYPELVRADAELEFPDYTSLGKKVVEDVRHVTAVEGTRLTLLCRPNKEMSTARLVDSDGKVIDLKPDERDKNVYRAGWLLARSRRLKLELIDREGRRNRWPPEFVVSVTPNRPPKIVVERPGRDVEVSPLEELQLQATISDDFGITRYGVSYAMGEKKTQELVLSADNAPAASPTATAAVDHLVDFERLHAEPDQLLSYFVWAEDFGPHGRIRRTMSDMYFAEVRPFEQIYRQGEQPSVGEQQQMDGGGAARQASELAELQKEIINGTWALLRRESAAEPSVEFLSDSRLLVDSQRTAMDRLPQMSERVRDAESQAHVEAAGRHMDEALKQLTSAADGMAIAPLRPALAAEQAAYQALLRLRAREFQVIRGMRQHGAPMAGRGGRSQRELNQLQLSADENRYETRRRATDLREDGPHRASGQILHRLRELARRQDDLNERLRELQSALQQSESPERRAEFERELKRLRDQQRAILRDTDELISRMEQTENQPAAQDARQQMEQGRSHLADASEALEQGKLPQALTEGTRAGRQLSQVRDQFRRRSANRFSEEITDLRRSARELAAEQQRLAEQLADDVRQSGRSLRDTGALAEVRQGLTQQRRELDKLVERMQRTVEDAEQPEPLLARQLYDTIRRAHQERVGDALELAQRLLEMGVEREASPAMRTANEGIDNLRQGVERAAQSVLGDETEALQRAQREVEQLAEELHRAIAEAGSDENRNELSVGDRQSRQPQEGQARNEQLSRVQGRDVQTPDDQVRVGRTPDARRSDRPSLRGQVRGNSGRAGAEIPGDGIQPFSQDGRRGGAGGPITGERFRAWSDRIRDVEEMLDDVELRSEAARIRGRAAEARAEFRRHATTPDWKQLRELVAEPLQELGRRIGEQIRRRESLDSRVPIDRDPVPPEFADGVRRYYERLGSGE